MLNASLVSVNFRNSTKSAPIEGERGWRFDYRGDPRVRGRGQGDWVGNLQAHWPHHNSERAARRTRGERATSDQRPARGVRTTDGRLGRPLPHSRSSPLRPPRTIPSCPRASRHGRVRAGQSYRQGLVRRRHADRTQGRRQGASLSERYKDKGEICVGLTRWNAGAGVEGGQLWRHERERKAADRERGGRSKLRCRCSQERNEG